MSRPTITAVTLLLLLLPACSMVTDFSGYMAPEQPVEHLDGALPDDVLRLDVAVPDAGSVEDAGSPAQAPDGGPPPADADVSDGATDAGLLEAASGEDAGEADAGTDAGCSCGDRGDATRACNASSPPGCTSVAPVVTAGSGDPDQTCWAVVCAVDPVQGLCRLQYGARRPECSPDGGP